MNSDPAVEPALITSEEIAALAELDGIELGLQEADELLTVVKSLTEFRDVERRIADMLDLPRPHGRDPGHVPSRKENPYNAFTRRCRVTGQEGGLLAGKTVGLKDNIFLAGVPTTNGSAMTPYTPVHDAVVVERILAAGGTIIGKLNMDDFGASGLGETSVFGPPRNPVDPSRSAGGSSGGSGAAVRSGEVDLALAVDQGGSGRIPAAFNGVVGVKPTHGLVPSWGIIHIDHTIDCVTPLARTAADVSLLLQAIAGADWRDAQWVRGPEIYEGYAGADDTGVQGLRVAIVRESVDPEICEPAVLANFERTAQTLKAQGALVREISIPLWRDGMAIFFPYIGHLFAETFRSDGQGWGHLGAYDVDAMAAYARGRREESRLIAQQVKAWIIADRFTHERSHGLAYARLHNARLALRHAISRAFEGCDVLLTPTLPITAPKLSDGEASFEEISTRTSDKLCYNTMPLNLSGHPAISLPNGVDADGLPTAAQLVARHFDEATAFRVAFAVEQSGVIAERWQLT